MKGKNILWAETESPKGIPSEEPPTQGFSVLCSFE